MTNEKEIQPLPPADDSDLVAFVIFLCSAADIMSDCPQCGAWAIVPLSAELRAIRTDGTTHACHPGFGGCNHGFAMQAPHPIAEIDLRSAGVLPAGIA